MMLEQHRLSDRAVRLVCLNVTESGRNMEYSSNLGKVRVARIDSASSAEPIVCIVYINAALWSE